MAAFNDLYFQTSERRERVKITTPKSSEIIEQVML